jgi:hypothetical protein
LGVRVPGDVLLSQRGQGEPVAVELVESIEDDADVGADAGCGGS